MSTIIRVKYVKKCAECDVEKIARIGFSNAPHVLLFDIVARHAKRSIGKDMKLCVKR